MNHESVKLELRQNENFASLERELPKTECLIILGGGIDQVTARNVETLREEKIWKPSRYVVETDPAIASRDKRTGLRKKSSKDEELDKDLVVHGGNAYLIAGIQFLDEMRGRGMTPRRIIFAAGRPDYIQNVTSEMEADEGKVMFKEFQRRTSTESLEGTVIEVRGEGSKNTAGDLLNGLKATLDGGLKSAVVIVTEARMERTEAMYAVLQEKFPKLSQIDTTFISAEDLLHRRYAERASTNRIFEEMQKKLKESALWEETKRREAKGIDDLKKGNYDLRISGVDTSGLV